MSEDRILRSESRTELQIPPFAKEEFDVECTPGCPKSVESFRSGNSEQKSCSPIGIRALYNVDGERPGLRNGEQTINPNISKQGSPSPSRSRSASRSPLRRILNPNSSYQNGRSPTMPTSTSVYGKRQPRDSAEQAVPSTIQHHSSTHYSPEVCDANIASIIYSSPSHEKGITPRKRTIPKAKFPWFWKRKILEPECHLEKKGTDFWSSEAKEQKRLRKEKTWRKVQEGQHGKSSMDRLIEWEKGLRQYDSCASWQRHVGHDTRKRYQHKLIKAAVYRKPISKIQELRTDAIMMENELFGTSTHLDEYKAKTRQIVNVIHSKRQSQENMEAAKTETPPKRDWRESVARARGKLKKFLPAKKSSSIQLWGSGQDSPTSSEESIPVTPCNCREKEIMSIRRLQEERIRTGEEDSRFQNEDTLNRLKKLSYKPKLKRIPPSYMDKSSAVGWSHTPREDPEDSVRDRDRNITSRRHGDELHSNNVHKAQFTDEEELDLDDWSIIDAEDSLKFANLCKCFG